jgi:hypothetical protein
LRLFSPPFFRIFCINLLVRKICTLPARIAVRGQRRAETERICRHHAPK